MKSKGLVLELGFIFVVLGLLSFVTYRQFALAAARSRDVERKSEIHEVSKVIRLYYKDYGKLPEEELFNSLWGKEWRDGDYLYMNIPKEDYLADKEYCFKQLNDSFALFIELENKNDPDCLKQLYECNGRQYCYRDVFTAVQSLE
ncbi:MAG: hypothetical protein KIH89_002790 [Candidatus Shapirobacteria bacterium]|nr:hypothetical protein [Candidatus Shapirobacteria bacterium]